MPDALVLDTNAFHERGLPHALAAYRGRKILPAVAAAEHLFHLSVNRGWTTERFVSALRESGIEVEPLDLHRALAAVLVNGRAFAENPTDHLIGAHALAPGRLLVTRNLEHHGRVPRKLTPGELVRRRR